MTRIFLGNVLDRDTGASAKSLDRQLLDIGAISLPTKRSPVVKLTISHQLSSKQRQTLTKNNRLAENG
jgi:hypothetical protein